MRPETRPASGASLRARCFVLAAALLPAAGCGRPAPAVAPPDRAEGASPPPVTVVAPERKALNRVVEQPGTVRAYEETQLFARVPGYVKLAQEPDGRITFDIGRQVRGPRLAPDGKGVEPGEVLAELVVPELEQETREKQAMVKHAEAQVVQAEKALASARATVAVAEAGVVEAKALHDRWESESARMAELARTGLLTPQVQSETLNQFRGAGGRLASARAAVLKAGADAEKAGADVSAARAKVDVARADAARSEAMLSYAKIRAPFDGVVTRRKVNRGDFVQPSGGKGDWLFTIARLDPVRIVVTVPEADAALVRDRAPVRLTIPALRGAVREGTVARTSWDLDPGSRTLRTEIDVPNKEGLLRPGMYVHAQITCGLPEAWVLPASAVVKQGDAWVCFLVEGGKAVRTPVQLGHTDGKHTEVLRYQKPGTPPTWAEFSGKESVAGRAAGLVDGQAIPSR